MDEVMRVRDEIASLVRNKLNVFHGTDCPAKSDEFDQPGKGNCVCWVGELEGHIRKGTTPEQWMTPR